MFQGDPMIVPAAILSTLIALAVFGISVRANREEKARGATPLWVYVFGSGCAFVFAALLFWASPRWVFASYLTMILGGIFVGSWLAYFAVRSWLEREVGRRDDA